MSQARIEDVRVYPQLAPDGTQAIASVEVDCAGEPGSLGWVVTEASGHDVAAGFAESTDGGFTVELAGRPLGGPYELHVGLTVDGTMVDSRHVTFELEAP